MAIKIIKLKEKQEKEYKKTCKSCGCKFSYTDEDIKHDWCYGGWYLFCPNEACKNFILHKSEQLLNIFGNRAQDC